FRGRSPRNLTLIFFVLCSPLAAISESYQGTRGFALSGALRGTVSLNEAIYFNPAAFAFASRYSIEGGSSFLPMPGAKPAWIYSGSVIDSQTKWLSGGFGYYHKTQDIESGKKTENAYHLAFSKILSSVIALGTTGKYIEFKDAVDEREAIDFDVGAFLVLTPKIQVGIVGQNLLSRDVSLIRQFGLGSRFQVVDFFFASVDLLKEDRGSFMENVSLHTGIEMIHENGLVLQGGLSLSDKSAKNLYSVGIGWSQHKFGLFYAFQNSMDGLARQTHALSLRVFY
ncbi:MAG: hypothetical protein AAB309_00890, partial [Deltaproteobacteria bacterium]